MKKKKPRARTRSAPKTERVPVSGDVADSVSRFDAQIRQIQESASARIADVEDRKAALLTGVLLGLGRPADVAYLGIEPVDEPAEDELPFVLVLGAK